MLDVAAALRHTVTQLAAGSAEGRLDFTEYDEEIIFTRDAGAIRITATYTTAMRTSCSS